MRRDVGFTLIELMIALALVGILSTIAIPAFMNFRAKSMRSEAKTQIGSLAVVQKAFFAERSTYTDNLVALGWSPEGSPRYLYGFTSDSMPAASGINDSAELATTTAAFSVAQMKDVFGVPLVASDLPAAPVGVATFVIGAVGNIDGDAVLDSWTLDHTGVLLNPTSDL